MSGVSAAAGRSSQMRPARRLAGPLVSAISLVAVVWWAFHERAPRLPTGAASVLALGLAELLYGCVTVVRGIRWHAILRQADCRASMADTQALVIVGYMGNTVLPVRGGELLRVFLLGRRTGGSRATIIGTILAERLLDIVALLSMLVALLVLVTTAGVRGAPQLGIAAALVALVLVLAVVVGWRGGRTRRLRRVGDQLALLTRASRNLLGPEGLMLALLTALVWVGEGGVYCLVGIALKLHLSLLQGCFLVVLSSLAATVPAAPGYVGTYDAAIQLGLRALRVHGSPAVGFGLLVRLVIFVPITVVGLFLVVFRFGGISSLRRLRWTAATGAAEEPSTIARLAE